MRKKVTRKVKRKLGLEFDKVFVILTFLLVGFGIFMIYDATIIHSQLVYGNAYRFVLLHIGWVILGLMSFFFFFSVDYRKLKSFTYALFVVSVLMLLVLAFLSLIPCESSLARGPIDRGSGISTFRASKISVDFVFGFSTFKKL
jgi:cell division protein FtsW (lipid II flippase)